MVLIRESPMKDLLGISNRRRGRFKYSVESQTSKLVHTCICPVALKDAWIPSSDLSYPKLWNSLKSNPISTPFRLPKN